MLLSRRLCILPSSTGLLNYHSVVSEGSAVASHQTSATPLTYDQLPGDWKKGWSSLYHFWKKDGFKNIHHLMVENYQRFGPIYRETLGTQNSVYIQHPEDAAALFLVEGIHPERLRVQPWYEYRDFRNKRYGVLLKSGEEWRCQRLILNREVLSVSGMHRFLPLLDNVGQDFVRRVYSQVERSSRGKWTADLTNELFRFALESVSYVLYGQRLGLLQDYINPESQEFIDSVTTMFHTTSPMLYIPPRLLRLINSSIWKNHVKAWDSIFNHADRCIQGIYSSLRHRSDNTYAGVLSSLLLQDKLPLEDIKASITELMAGGVDTTAVTLQWAMYELARVPAIQEKLRSEIVAARAASGDDLAALLKRIPLVKAALKETLRLHPVAITLQRYTWKDTVIRNYMIPKGTLVQVGLYAMGRNPDIFTFPERFSPERWLGQESTHFRGLSFGFGPRQCLGRRIAEMEMQLFLVHVLENFKIETNRMVEVESTFNLILFPTRPIQLTLSPLSLNGSERHS
ncbi:cholesterol side-chain cleavage enzyme, mitochondrial isoform X1 [Bufo gargarizans]|uniref:cholesterol side-chain cleavage enzyme, mitochondrial isoform X1 n=2 Tax=Bufo gargarizans TaxID=30331 RepID=UPI001CF54C05|nr:cholesterol side-chain cleavage enzyme, mitochondrial isoform X1 [Bufo gargarizans]